MTSNPIFKKIDSIRLIKKAEIKKNLIWSFDLMGEYCNCPAI